MISDSNSRCLAILCGRFFDTSRSQVIIALVSDDQDGSNIAQTTSNLGRYDSEIVFERREFISQAHW